MLCPCPQLAVFFYLFLFFLPYCKTDQPFSHNSNRDDFKQAVEHFSCSQNQGETWFVWPSVCCMRECNVIRASVTRPVAWAVDISGLNSGYCIYSCPSQDSGKPCSVTCPSHESGSWPMLSYLSIPGQWQAMLSYLSIPGQRRAVLSYLTIPWEWHLGHAQLPVHPRTVASHAQLPVHPRTVASHARLPVHPMTTASHVWLPVHPRTVASHVWLPVHPRTVASHVWLPIHPRTAANLNTVHPWTVASHAWLPVHPRTVAIHAQCGSRVGLSTAHVPLYVICCLEHMAETWKYIRWLMCMEWKMTPDVSASCLI